MATFLEVLLNEIEFRFSKSSGPGGQNVNKVSSKVTLSWSVQTSAAITENDKQKIIEKLANKINQSGALILHCDTTRSAVLNKELAIKKLIQLIKNALKEPKRRIRTKPSYSAVKERLQTKKRASEIKKLRRERFD